MRATKQIEFPILYSISRDGVAKRTSTTKARISSRYSIRSSRRFPNRTHSATIRCNCSSQISITIEYVGRLAIGRIFSGEIAKNQEVAVARRDGSIQKTRVKELFVLRASNAQRSITPVPARSSLSRGLTMWRSARRSRSIDMPRPLPVIAVDEPTHLDDLWRQHVAVCRHRGQIRNVASDQGAARPRNSRQRRVYGSARPKPPNNSRCPAEANCSLLS